MVLQKRGQITAFIIVGIIILSCAGILIYLNANDAKAPAEISSERLQQAALFGSSIPQFVEYCQREAVNEAIIENSLTGGYFVLPEKRTSGMNDDVPYFLYSGQNLFPTEDMIAEEIGSYADAVLGLCLGNFEKLKELGYNISYEEPSSVLVLDQKSILIKTKMPLSASKDTQTKQFNEFTANIPAEQLYNDINAARKIAESQEARQKLGKGDEICISCYSDIAAQNGLFVNILPYHNNTYIFDVQDNDYVINGEKYRLRFAVDYEENDEDD